MPAKCGVGNSARNGSDDPNTDLVSGDLAILNASHASQSHPLEMRRLGNPGRTRRQNCSGGRRKPCRGAPWPGWDSLGCFPPRPDAAGCAEMRLLLIAPPRENIESISNHSDRMPIANSASEVPTLPLSDLPFPWKEKSSQVEGSRGALSPPSILGYRPPMPFAMRLRAPSIRQGFSDPRPRPASERSEPRSAALSSRRRNPA